MHSQLLRPVLLAAMAMIALAATASLALAEGPSHWKDDDCHAIDSGRTLCWEDRGLFGDNVNESGHWTFHYRGDTNWTIYAADGGVEYTQRTTVNLVEHSAGPESSHRHETFHYRYGEDGYSCSIRTQLMTVDGEVRVEHEVHSCGLESAGE